MLAFVGRSRSRGDGWDERRPGRHARPQARHVSRFRRPHRSRAGRALAIERVWPLAVAARLPSSWSSSPSRGSASGSISAPPARMVGVGLFCCASGRLVLAARPAASRPRARRSWTGSTGIPASGHRPPTPSTTPSPSARPIPAPGRSGRSTAGGPRMPSAHAGRGRRGRTCPGATAMPCARLAVLAPGGQRLRGRTRKSGRASPRPSTGASPESRGPVLPHRRLDRPAALYPRAAAHDRPRPRARPCGPRSIRPSSSASRAKAAAEITAGTGLTPLPPKANQRDRPARGALHARRQRRDHRQHRLCQQRPAHLRRHSRPAAGNRLLRRRRRSMRRGTFTFPTRAGRLRHRLARRHRSRRPAASRAAPSFRAPTALPRHSQATRTTRPRPSLLSI